MSDVLYIIDGDTNFDFEAECLYWRGVNIPSGALSLNKIITDNGRHLRTRYLDFIDSLSVRVCDAEGLDIRSGLNIWRFSRLKEKAHSDVIYNVLGLYVLEDLVRKNGYSKIVLHSSDRTLRKAVGCACSGWEVAFSFVAETRAIRFSFQDIIRALPNPVLGILYFFYYLSRRLSLLPHQSKCVENETVNPVLQMVTYFPNIDMDAAHEGHFRSQYWGKINELLDKQSIAVQWLLLYTGNPQLPNYRKAASFVRRLNERTKHWGGKQSYELLDNSLTPRLALRVFSDYLRLCFNGLHCVGLLKDNNAISGTEAAQLILLMRDWLSSIRGIRALEACLWTNQFEAAVGTLPDSVSACFYLYENQPWEQALLYALGQQQGIKSVGVQHSSIRFFDFRYFDKQTGSSCYAEPDRIAVNGRGAWDALIESQVLAERLVKVEAVRYLYLSGVKSDHPSRMDVAVDSERKHLLVLTDYMPESAFESLAMLARMLGIYSGDLTITVKPHPFLPVSDMLKELGLVEKVTLVYDQLETLWPSIDIVFSSNQTTAALEAAFNGISTIVAISSGRLNANPLVGVDGVAFVSSGDELANAISVAEKPYLPDDYFYLDIDIPRWNHLLRDCSLYSQKDNHGAAQL